MFLKWKNVLSMIIVFDVIYVPKSKSFRVWSAHWVLDVLFVDYQSISSMFSTYPFAHTRSSSGRRTTFFAVSLSVCSCSSTRFKMRVKFMTIYLEEGTISSFMRIKWSGFSNRVTFQLSEKNLSSWVNSWKMAGCHSEKFIISETPLLDLTVQIKLNWQYFRKN